METITHFLNNNQTLEEFYTHYYHTQVQSSATYTAAFASYTHTVLMQPEEWFKALATLEAAIDATFDVSKTEAFLIHIFKGYDCYASADLNDTDYDFFWNKIHQIFDKFAVSSSEAIVEQALQFYNPRREYRDRSKRLQFLEKAIERGSENASILLGYDYYIGLCGVLDKEKGLELINSVESTVFKQKARIFKNFILLYEQKTDEASALLDELLAEGIDDSLLTMAYEQKAYIHELKGEYQEAFEYYTKAIDDSCSGFSTMHIGFFHYNGVISNADPRKGLEFMEQSFNCGRPEVARSLFYCYFQSGQEWQDDTRGIYWVEKGYQYYDAYSTYQLAYLYLYYDDYKDIEKGLFYLDKAVEMNYADALAHKGYMYHVGDIIEKDIEKSIDHLNRAIELGSGFAAYRMGVLYEDGSANNNEPDYKTALTWYEKCAELGHVYGYEICGRYYANGYAGEEDYEKAFNYYNTGAELDSAYCKAQLAFCYRRGLGTEENPDEAIRHLQMVVEENMPDVFTELAMCYEEGYGIEENGKKALEYMLKAAEQEYVYAQYKVGCYYLYGLEGVPVDYDESFKWMSKAAEAEYPYALLEMGDYYLWDYGEKDERPKAYEYYVKAAGQGYVNEGLGTCLEYGIGVEENEAEALKYYLQGAEDGYLRAMYNAGRCYYHGFGIKENFDEAFRWFNDAAGHEFIPGMYYKGKMLLSGEGCMQNMEEGIALLTQAAENDYAEAQFLLANCYLIGKGVEANEDLAMDLFEKAADNGHEQAQKVTGRRVRK